jgi:hypothetical protein
MTTAKNIKDMISRQQAADRLGKHIRSVDYYLKTRKLTKYRDGFGRVWIDPEEVDLLNRPVAEPVAVVSSDL